MTKHPYFRKHIAITNEHGSWVLLLSPLITGIVVGENLNLSSGYLFFAVVAVFLLRQPMTILVKIYSKRRPRTDFQAAVFWIFIYGIISLIMSVILVTNGFAFILYLVIPGIPVFIWHLILVSKRAERRQMGIEIVASGVLALSAPAAFWVGAGYPNPRGWWLWGLIWLQSAGSIVYAFLRLEQRNWKTLPSWKDRFRAGRRSLTYTSFNLLLVIGLSTWQLLPSWTPIPFLIQFLESLWGSFIKPAVGYKPSRIGFRQLTISVLFTILFIWTWKLS
jgi:hypothetical protein